jgi:integrase
MARSRGLGDVYKRQVQIGWWTGLRLSDICTLEWSAFVDGDIIVHTIKRDRRVQIPMSHPAIGGGILNLVLLEMAENRTSSRFCFPDAAEAIMDVNRRSKFSVAFMRLLNRLDIYGRSFHCLRHSFVTRLAAEGIEMEAIGKLVGHAQSGTTMGYNHLPAAKKAKARRGLVVHH